MITILLRQFYMLSIFLQNIKIIQHGYCQTDREDGQPGGKKVPSVRSYDYNPPLCTEQIKVIFEKFQFSATLMGKVLMRIFGANGSHSFSPRAFVVYRLRLIPSCRYTQPAAKKLPCSYSSDEATQMQTQRKKWPWNQDKLRSDLLRVLHWNNRPSRSHSSLSVLFAT